MIIIDFTFYLTLAVVVTGVIALLDILFLAKKRHAANQKQPMIIEYARAFFPVLLLVLIIRSFIVQPYRVPSSSLAPTVMPGDFIAVKQYAIWFAIAGAKHQNCENQRTQTWANIFISLSG